MQQTIKTQHTKQQLQTTLLVIFSSAVCIQTVLINKNRKNIKYRIEILLAVWIVANRMAMLNYVCKNIMRENDTHEAYYILTRSHTHTMNNSQLFFHSQLELQQ